MLFCSDLLSSLFLSISTWSISSHWSGCIYNDSVCSRIPSFSFIVFLEFFIPLIFKVISYYISFWSSTGSFVISHCLIIIFSLNLWSSSLRSYLKFHIVFILFETEVFVQYFLLARGIFLVMYASTASFAVFCLITITVS